MLKTNFDAKNQIATNFGSAIPIKMGAAQVKIKYSNKNQLDTSKHQSPRDKHTRLTGPATYETLPNKKVRTQKN